MLSWTALFIFRCIWLRRWVREAIADLCLPKPAVWRELMNKYNTWHAAIHNMPPGRSWRRRPEIFPRYQLAGDYIYGIICWRTGLFCVHVLPEALPVEGCPGWQLWPLAIRSLDACPRCLFMLHSVIGVWGTRPSWQDPTWLSKS